jgi:hypothetical protein
VVFPLAFWGQAWCVLTLTACVERGVGREEPGFLLAASMFSLARVDMEECSNSIDHNHRVHIHRSRVRRQQADPRS